MVTVGGSGAGKGEASPRSSPLSPPQLREEEAELPPLPSDAERSNGDENKLKSPLPLVPREESLVALEVATLEVAAAGALMAAILLRQIGFDGSRECVRGDALVKV